MTSQQGCSFCKRFGLPIFPVRPAVVVADDALPHLPASISMPVPAQGKTAYSSRLLREGYLYIWNERAKLWINYYATADGYYYPLPEDGRASPRLLSGELTPCITEPQELARASLVTLPVLPAPMQNGRFWFCWSESEWTPATRLKHEDPAWQEKYMQCFDLQSWITTQHNTNALPLSQLQDTVAEYSTRVRSAKIKEYAGNDFIAKKPQLDAMNMLSAAEALGQGEGAIFVLHDPVAILQDISSIIPWQLNQQLYLNPKYQRPLVSASMIMQTKEAIINQLFEAKLSESDKAEEKLRKGHTSSLGIPVPAMPGLADQAHHITDATLQMEVTSEWQSYARYYNEIHLQSFLDEFNQAAADVDAQIKTPMTEMYLAWFQQDILINYFQHNFDPQNLRSGFDYNAAVQYAIAGMQDKSGAATLFLNLLTGDTLDARNILTRAVVMNHDPLAKRLAALTQKSGGLLTQPWHNFAEVTKETLGKMEEHSAGYLGSLLGFIGGSLTQLIEKAAANKSFYAVFAAIGGISKSAFYPVEVEGGFKKFVAAVARNVVRLSPQGSSIHPAELRRSIKHRLRILGIQGLPLEGTAKKRFIAAINLQTLNDINAAPGNARDKPLSLSLTHPEEVDRLLFQRWRGNITTGVQQLAHASPFLWGVMSVAFQAAALKSAMDFSITPLTEVQKEVRNRFWASVVSMSGSTLGTLEAGIIKFHKLGAAFQGSSAEKVAKFFGAGSRYLGAAGGVVAAYYDITNMIQQADKKHFNLAIPYGLSAVSGIYISFAPFINWEWIGRQLLQAGTRFEITALRVLSQRLGALSLTLGWIAVAVFFASALFISALQQNELQRWLELSYFGITPAGLPAAKYPTLDMEVQALSAILKGEE